jgi:hypothetical protein
VVEEKGTNGISRVDVAESIAEKRASANNELSDDERCVDCSEAGVENGVGGCSSLEDSESSIGARTSNLGSAKGDSVVSDDGEIPSTDLV